MPPQHLVADGPRDVGERKLAGLLRHARVKHDLEQQVAELVLEVRQVVALDGVGDFVSLLDRVWRDRRERLLEVPGATALPMAQRGHDRQ